MSPPAATFEPIPSVTKPASLQNGFDNKTAKSAQHRLNPDYTIVEQPIGTRRPIRVVCLGAGYSGLMMGIVFNERMKDANAEFVIYERNADLGGTWYENR
jgi:cation diffusion facilitator CzcD-associated flavoprotein CzcO